MTTANTPVRDRALDALHTLWAAGDEVTLEAIVDCILTSLTPPLTFEEAWAEFERRGYQYGRDALEQVHFGWRIAQLAHIAASRIERERWGHEA